MSQKENEGKDMFDFDGLLTRTDGDKALACQLMEMYLEQTVENLAAIEDAISKHDGKRLQFVAHSLKGSSADLSAEKVREIAYKMEKTGASGDLSGAPALLVQLKESINITKGLISKTLKDCRSTKGEKF